MARTALGLGVREIAEHANVSPNTIARLERGAEMRASTVAAIRAALEAAGVIFVEENGEGPGVRLRKSGPAAIPVEELASRLRELPKDREVVAYCRGPYCVMAVDAVVILRKRGYRASRLEIGVMEGRARGLRVETGAEVRS